MTDRYERTAVLFLRLGDACRQFLTDGGVDAYGVGTWSQTIAPREELCRVLDEFVQSQLPGLFRIEFDDGRPGRAHTAIRADNEAAAREWFADGWPGARIVSIERHD